MGRRLGDAVIIREHRRAELIRLAVRSRQVVLAAAITGVTTGLLVAGFDWLVVDGLFEHVSELPLGAIAIMPLVGLLVGYAARRWIGGQGTSAATSDEYLHAYHDHTHALSLRRAAGRMVASIVTLGCGVPMGLEGPSLYLGATIGDNVQRRLRRVFHGAEHAILMVAGAAAGVAAIFKAPFTGAVFAMEVPYQDDLARRMLLPALVASATSYLVFAGLHGTTPLFPIEGGATFSIPDLLGAVLLGVLGGLGARAFAWLLRRAKRIAATAPGILAALGGGTAIAALFVIGRFMTGESLAVGSGYAVIEWATSPGHSLPLLLGILALRCAGTAAAVAGGGVGGLFIPLVAAGALSGAMIARIIEHGDFTLFVVIGVAAFLGAGYRVPLAAVTFVAETTGRPAFVVPGLLAAVAAELMMGEASITTYQRSATREVRPAPAHS